VAITTAKIAIVGCGPGGPQYVSEAARSAVAGADVLVASRRLAALFPHHRGELVEVDAHVDALLEQIESLRSAGRRVAVLVSGDPGLFSLAGQVVRRFGRAECEIVPAVSSVQLAFARLGLDWADSRILSAHGRTPEAAVEELSQCDKIAVLAGGRESLGWLAAAATALAPSHTAFLAENLSMPGESVREASADDLAAANPTSLAVVVFVRRSLL
jgi:cobalt-precorrin-7 (C5)-methyltransferase